MPSHTASEASIDLVAPGEAVSSDENLMHGHGTYVTRDGIIKSSVIGRVIRVNNLASVKCVWPNYQAQVGDFVVGRIYEIQQKKWKVDIGASMGAILPLSAIHLPGGIQRRKQISDELNMQLFFKVGDLIVAEVQNVSESGHASLHTRSSKFGRLRNGQLLKTSAYYIKRARNHVFEVSSTNKVRTSVILGVNGFVFVRAVTESAYSEENFDQIYDDKNTTFTILDRKQVANVINCIRILLDFRLPINKATVEHAVKLSENMKKNDTLLLPENIASKVLLLLNSLDTKY